MGISPIPIAAKADDKNSLPAASLALLSLRKSTNYLPGFSVLNYLKSFFIWAQAWHLPYFVGFPVLLAFIPINFSTFFFFNADLSVLFVFCLNLNLFGLLVKWIFNCLQTACIFLHCCFKEVFRFDKFSNFPTLPTLKIEYACTGFVLPLGSCYNIKPNCTMVSTKSSCTVLISTQCKPERHIFLLVHIVCLRSSQLLHLEMKLICAQ